MVVIVRVWLYSYLNDNKDLDAISLKSLFDQGHNCFVSSYNDWFQSCNLFQLVDDGMLSAENLEAAIDYRWV